MANWKRLSLIRFKLDNKKESKRVSLDSFDYKNKPPALSWRFLVSIIRLTEEENSIIF